MSLLGGCDLFSFFVYRLLELFVGLLKLSLQDFQVSRSFLQDDVGLLVEVLGLNNGLLVGSFSLDMSNGSLSPVVDELSMGFSSFQLIPGVLEDFL